LIKRPFILIYLSAIMLLLGIIDYNVPSSAVGKIFIGAGNLEGGNVSVTIVNVLRIFLGFIFKFTIIFEVILYVLGIAIVLGIVFSGYLNFVKDAVGDLGGMRRSYASGFKKHYLKIIIMTFVSIILTVVFTLFFIVSSIPAMILTSAAVSGSSEYLIAAIFVDFVTAAVLLFSLMFFRTYIVFWYDAAIKGKKKAFIEGKRIADANFWTMASRLLVLDLTFVASLLFFNLFGNALIVYALKWSFNAIFFSFMITYMFTLIKEFEGTN